MTLTRRDTIAMVVGGGIAATAGCLGEETPAGSQEANEDGGTNALGSNSNCRTVTKTRSTTVADKAETVSAGADWVFRSDQQEGDVIKISVRKIGGEARPAMVVEDPTGNVVADSGPSRQIQREVYVRQDGRYYVRFHNEALINSGMWEVQIEVEEEYQDEVCS